MLALPISTLANFSFSSHSMNIYWVHNICQAWCHMQKIFKKPHTFCTWGVQNLVWIIPTTYPFLFPFPSQCDHTLPGFRVETIYSRACWLWDLAVLTPGNPLATLSYSNYSMFILILDTNTGRKNSLKQEYLKNLHSQFNKPDIE